MVVLKNFRMEGRTEPGQRRVWGGLEEHCVFLEYNVARLEISGSEYTKTLPIWGIAKHDVKGARHCWCASDRV
jgi:hypothetical protein